ncbi:hypothetical protein OGAPHI_002913 [Ogataea philodendri]|uniref:BHLH domain-containing protein n=1 Tax=Ogataea philodendri TaxID=1378263 RepID=A0A9P8T6D3_9ASCO|nr:uncharacterized protein OGAPHI_002913 [Ogataea philodendri]KAH3667264.1 hypothetical protein OGAPHI_002913 [Ogataea philodendri]
MSETDPNSVRPGSSLGTGAPIGSGLLPPPPIFKPTFVQMNKTGSSTESKNASPVLAGSSNSNYLTSSFVSNEEYKNKLIQQSPSISPMTYAMDMPSPGPASPALTANRKRRKSMVTTKEELERKRKELKSQHSIIEKKRRIKMNREFEALKFMVPACRLNILNGLNDNNFDNSNMMHKLTILQSTVEYIKYLHLVIKLLKLQMLTPSKTRPLFQRWLAKNDNLRFVDFDLDLQAYRTIENEFNFEELFLKVWKNDGEMPDTLLDAVSKEVETLANKDDDGDDSDEDELEATAARVPQIGDLAGQLPTELPSPLVTPDIRDLGRPSTVRTQSLPTVGADQTSPRRTNAKFKLPLPAIVDDKMLSGKNEQEVNEMDAPKMLMMLKSDDKRTSIGSLLN